MQAKLTSLLLATGLITSVMAQCPADAAINGVQGLFFLSDSQQGYSVHCGLEYYTPTNLDSMSTADAIECAA